MPQRWMAIGDNPPYPERQEEGGVGGYYRNPAVNTLRDV